MLLLLTSSLFVRQIYFKTNTEHYLLFSTSTYVGQWSLIDIQGRINPDTTS